MTADPTAPPDLAALDQAIAQARTELDAMGQAASAAAAAAPLQDADYSLHEVAGVGRYAIPRRTGWQAMLGIIHDPAADIDFSAKLYPAFDGILGEHFNTPHLLDPLDSKYDAPWEPYKRLRDNIAAVRNFIMESYYANTPPGMTPEKAKASLEEIAAFVGDGLYNNWRVGLGGVDIIPVHDPRKPFISLSEASVGGGAGAQYIYDKILEMHRQSNWMRPFAAVLSLFGGEAPPDWMLPPAGDTHFTDLFASELRNPQAVAGPTPEEMAAAIARVEALKAQRAQLQAQHDLNAMAYDLDAVGSELLFSAEHMQDVTALAEPVRYDAIEIARDILRKLKFSLGNLNILDGLNLKPTDDMATLGAIKGVATVYERLLAWGRGIDGSIMQHPSIIAATQSIGQLGTLAKIEALKIARAAGNRALAESLTEQIKRIPASYAAATDKTFGGLIDKIDQGITTILTRVQTISGPSSKVGFSAGNELGSYMNAAPTAGLAMQAGAEGVGDRDSAGKRNAAVLQAEEMAAQAQAARLQSANAARAAAQGTTNAQPARSGNARQAAQQARNAQQRASSTQPSSATANAAATNAATAAQRQQAALRNANATRAAHEHEEELHHQQQQQQLRQAQIIQQQQQAARQAAAKAAAAKAAVQRIDLNTLKGFQTATSTKGMGPVAPVRKPAPPPTPPAPAVDPKNPYAVQPPPTPTTPGKTGGRGV